MLSASTGSPFAAIARERWKALGAGEASIGYDELAGLSGLGEPVAQPEVDEVYVPLVRLLALRAREPLPSTEAPAEPSRIWAPSGLFPTAEERVAGGRFRRDEEPARVAT